jgi:phospholipid-binding lipoprotein MlaA
MLKYLSIVSALVLMVCATHSLAASSSSRDHLIAQQKEQKEEASDDLSDLMDADDEEPIAVEDPIASWNRAMFQFNDKLYFYLLKPVAQVWQGFVGAELRYCIKRAFDNIRFPIRFFNCLLQGKGKAAGDETIRFLINTTIGVAGLGDPAKEWGFDPPKEDFGQTLAVWGAGNGSYLVWPFIGPSTVRDSFGLAGDLALDPLSYFTILFSGLGFEVTIPLRIGQTVNEASLRIGDYEALKEAAIDPYEAFKNAYIQYRRKKIKE